MTSASGGCGVPTSRLRALKIGHVAADRLGGQLRSEFVERVQTTVVRVDADIDASITARAAKLARLVYWMRKHGAEYVAEGAAQSEEEYRRQRLWMNTGQVRATGFCPRSAARSGASVQRANCPCEINSLRSGCGRADQPETSGCHVAGAASRPVGCCLVEPRIRGRRPAGGGGLGG
jgi:hypothetical protein